MISVPIFTSTSIEIVMSVRSENMSTPTMHPLLGGYVVDDVALLVCILQRYNARLISADEEWFGFKGSTDDDDEWGGGFVEDDLVHEYSILVKSLGGGKYEIYISRVYV